MGGACTTSYTDLPSSGSTVEGTEIPEWVTAAGREAFMNAYDIVNKAPTAGEDIPSRIASYDVLNEDGNVTRTSEFTEDERTGMNLISDNYADYIPYLNKANTTASGLGQGYDSLARTRTEQFDDKGISTGYDTKFDYSALSGSPYRDPDDPLNASSLVGATREDLMGGEFQIGEGTEAQKYLDMYDTAMDPAAREIQEQTTLANRNLGLNAGMGGTFGSRLGLLESENTIGGAEASGDLRAQAAKEGLGFAANRFDTDRASRVGIENLLFGQRGVERDARFDAEAAAKAGYETDEAARLARVNSYRTGAQTDIDLNSQVAAGLISVGEAKRMADQRKLDMQYADFMDTDFRAREDVNFALGALAGIPYNTRSRAYENASSYVQDPSVLGQAISGAGTAISGYKLLNQ